jgi:UDP-N-acetylmuramoyl-tripeptide--D-alanyl-D-alanine ligase
MRDLLLREIIQKIDGSLICGMEEQIIRNVVTNVVTRPDKLENNTLFFDLKGNKEPDLDTIRKYRYSAVVTDIPEAFNNIEFNISIVQVKSVIKAYWKFVNYYRNQFKIPVIGITGTTGKTTTKEMITHILSKKFKVASTYLSNNGVVRNLSYLLDIEDNTDIAVFEMGAAYPGDITYSCKYFNPQIRLILNIGVHHMAESKNPEQYLKSKAEMLSGIDKTNGVVLLNSDDENIKKLDITGIKQVVYFGMDEKAKFRGKNIIQKQMGISFILDYSNEEYEVFVPGYGRHNAYNALAAIAAVSQVGIDVKEACEALLTYKPLNRHLQVTYGAGGCIFINDSWNTSSMAMEAALQFLKDISGKRKRIAILGNISNLGTGPYSIEQHEKIGEKVAEIGVDYLIVIGTLAESIGKRAIAVGMNKDNVYFSKTGAEIMTVLKPYLNSDSTILFKVDYYENQTKEIFYEIYDKIIIV